MKGHPGVALARVGEGFGAPLARLVADVGLTLVVVPPGRSIPGSYWGAPEAGLLDWRIFVRDDTPVHSVLHEAGHSICMGESRRLRLATDAGGDDREECAVCYLQVLLADQVAGYGRARCCADMDAWGYSFRLGSARAWFAGDAEDARAWLLSAGLIDATDDLRVGVARRATSPAPASVAAGRPTR